MVSRGGRARCSEDPRVTMLRASGGACAATRRRCALRSRSVVDRSCCERRAPRTWWRSCARAAWADQAPSRLRRGGAGGPNFGGPVPEDRASQPVTAPPAPLREGKAALRARGVSRDRRARAALPPSKFSAALSHHEPVGDAVPIVGGSTGAQGQGDSRQRGGRQNLMPPRDASTPRTGCRELRAPGADGRDLQ